MGKTNVRLWLTGAATALLAVAGTLGGAAAETIAGDARVIDADIIIVGTQRIILWGLDAPDRTQTCLANGAPYNCYDAAYRTLEDLVLQGSVSCETVGEPDRFNRYHGVCVSAGGNINEAMVRAGVAMAFVEQTEDYVLMQDEAKLAKTGIWADAVELEEPWVHRRRTVQGGMR